MINEYSRMKRVSHEMQKKIAIILQREMQDNRIHMATVSEVRVSRDLSSAKIFVTFLNGHINQQFKIGIRTLQSASGFIRSILSKSMRLPVVPKLTFTYDHTLMEGIRMTNLINKVIQNDRQRHCK